jgi:protein phosphatase-4 regulatory subunit 3
VAQLLTVPQKHLKLTALKFFRTLVGLQDTFYLAQLTHNNTFGLILDIVHETMPRDNLLNSACLELFEFIKRDNIKPIITHVVEKYREKLKAITYVDIFEKLIQRYDELQGYGLEADATLFSQEEIPPSQRGVLNGQRWQGVREMDAAEEEYFNTSDDEEEWPSDTRQEGLAIVNQTASHVRLVDYPDDDDDDVMDAKLETTVADKQEIELPERGLVDTNSSPTTPSTSQHPLERLSEKRRRNEDDEDELGRLAQNGPKRRSSSASSTASMYFRRRQNSIDRNLKNSANNEVSTPTTNAAPKKIAINLSSALKSHITLEAEAIQLSEFDEQAPNGEEHKETNEGETATPSS